MWTTHQNSRGKQSGGSWRSSCITVAALGPTGQPEIVLGIIETENDFDVVKPGFGSELDSVGSVVKVAGFHPGGGPTLAVAKEEAALRVADQNAHGIWPLCGTHG